MNRMVGILHRLLFVLCVTTAYFLVPYLSASSDLPEEVNYVFKEGDKSVKGKYIEKSYSLNNFDLFDKQFLEKSYEDIQKYFGKTEAYHPDTGSAVETVKACYISANPQDKTLVLFSSGPMGGYGRAVDAIVVMKDKKSYEYVRTCSPSRKINKKIIFRNGLRLGLTKTEVKKKMGEQVSLEQENLLIYDFVEKKDIIKNEVPEKGATVTLFIFRSMRLSFDKDILSGIVVSFFEDH